jgi:hypothetical protein
LTITLTERYGRLYEALTAQAAPQAFMAGFGQMALLCACALLTVFLTKPDDPS